MRRPGFCALLGCALACSGPPVTGEGEHEGARVVEVEIEEGAGERDPDPIAADVAADVGAPGQAAPDPLLAAVRAQLRGGRAPAQLRRQLLESRDPDHRHAGRLLQAIADEAPEPVLTRAGGLGKITPAPTRPVEPPSIELPKPSPAAEPSPAAKLEPSEPVEAAAPAGFDDETIDPPPKLASLPPGSPAHAWFDAGVVELEPPEPEPEPELGPERLLGPELLLLRERPPVVVSPDAGAGPRLVILTSVSLRAEPGGDAITLELAGAGPAALQLLPWSSSRVRVVILSAGAVPSFLAARPRRPELEVVEVTRGEGFVELEVELAHGWSLVGAARLDNGASVRFEREAVDGEAF